MWKYVKLVILLEHYSYAEDWIRVVFKTTEVRRGGVALMTTRCDETTVRYGVLLAALFAVQGGIAQAGEPTPAREGASAAAVGGQPTAHYVYDAFAKLPNFWHGVWMPVDATAIVGANRPAITPKYRKLAAETAKASLGVDKNPCLPPGMPGMMLTRHPIEFIFAPGKVIVVAEAHMQVRYVWTDGRQPPGPDALNPSFNGYSIGRWERDTLIVDTIGLHENTVIATVPIREEARVPVTHGPQLRIRENIRLVGQDRLQIDTTLFDPDVLVKPWTYTTVYTRRSNPGIGEFSCRETAPPP